MSGSPPAYGGVTVICTRHRQQVRVDAQGHLRHPAGRWSVAGERCDSAEFVLRQERLANADAALSALREVSSDVQAQGAGEQAG